MAGTGEEEGGWVMQTPSPSREDDGAMIDEQERARDYTLMTFPQAMQAVMDGRAVTRVEWGDDKVYVFLRQGTLCLAKDGAVFSLIVRDGDMFADDWRRV